MHCLCEDLINRVDNNQFLKPLAKQSFKEMQGSNLPFLCRFWPGPV